MMSRPSVRSRPRESIFTSGSEFYRSDSNSTCPPNLLECVYALDDCCEEAYEAHRLLRDGTADLPRMTKVLESQRVFLLVDEGTVRKYKAELTDEIEPQINELIDRAEKGVKALHKRQSVMQAKIESAQSRPAIRAVTGASAAHKLETRRLQMLTKQRQRLEEDLEFLEAEVYSLETKAMKR